MRSNFRLFLTLLLLNALFFASCGPKSSTATRYHCPMHPSYVSERPGDCPICGMRLVPIEDRGAPTPTPVATPTATAQGRKILFYRNPMDPTVTSPVPAKDSMGMDFVPVYEDELPREETKVPGYAPVQLAPEGLAKAGVQTTVATAGKLGGTIRAVGVVVPDERLVRHVQTKVAGWVEKLFVNTTGQQVRQGEPLLALYSPELLASQEEYLKALKLAQELAQSPFPEAQKAAGDLLAAAR
jgi:Cu(I)/Ag(I) efflux system membrane fusion protein